MPMNSERAMKLVMDCKREAELIEARHAEELAPLKEKIKLLTQWLQEKAQMEGLKNISVAGVGTGYFRTSISCRIGNKSVFRDFVQSNDLWDLAEIRGVGTEVKKYIETHGAVPPGVNFSQIETFHIRGANDKE